ncbi:MAG: hypothetical protein AB202_01420 [Parcubacteria bacterium C7867-007]|nr:MAG: hypothetical protein AB202_01420 [Parcubacteria bacterium C7867-007]
MQQFRCPKSVKRLEVVAVVVLIAGVIFFSVLYVIVIAPMESAM